MNYSFDGNITSLKEQSVPFVLRDGRIRFPVGFANFVDINKKDIVLHGLTKNGKEIHLVVEHLWQKGAWREVVDGKEVMCAPHIEGVVGVCATMEPNTFNKVDSLGFYSLEIPKITNQSISGCLNDDNSSWMGIKKPIGSFKLGDSDYKLSIGFMENRPFYQGQLLELRNDKNYDLRTMKDAYLVIKRLLCFLYQKRIIPLDQVLLRSNEKNVGQLFVDNTESSKYVFDYVKCIPINSLGKDINLLLQLLADDKIYLRHIPVFKEDENVVTHGRFLMALIGIENVLDSLNIHAYQPESNREKLKDRICYSITSYKQEVSNFFVLNSLGNDIQSISSDLAIMRNKMAHGKLEYNLTIKSAYQMQFLMLFILFLQLISIGVDKKKASEIVPLIMFKH